MNRTAHTLRLIAMLLSIAIAWPATAQSAPSITIHGVVRDAKSKKKLDGATVWVTGSNIATVTNEDGAYSLQMPAGRQVAVSMLGYDNAYFTPDSPDATHDVALRRVSHVLPEVVVHGGRADEVMRAALLKIPDNYSRSDNMLTLFYRETVRKGKRYVGVSEAVIDVYKTPYAARLINRDRVQVLKGRRLMSQKSRDTLAVKIEGGPYLSVFADLVKNEGLLFGLDNLSHYTFAMESPTSIDNRQQFVISFTPRVELDYALMHGKVYIDAESLCFTRAEFDLDMTDKVKATRAVLHKKPAGLRFNLQRVRFTVAYRQGSDGMPRLSYVENEMVFKCDWKRRLFSSSYTTHAEMVVIDVDTDPASTISRQQAYKPQQIFYDMVDQYWDRDYWADYNIIEPSESLEKAVSRLRR